MADEQDSPKEPVDNAAAGSVAVNPSDVDTPASAPGDSGAESATSAAPPVDHDAAVAATPAQPPARTAPLRLPEFSSPVSAAATRSIELIRDVCLRVKIELGRTRMAVQDVLKLGDGSVVELDKLAGDPVDVFVNDRLVARGEVLVLKDNFCVRVSEILAPPRDRVPV